jgi:hypothetical protein
MNMHIAAPSAQSETLVRELEIVEADILPNQEGTGIVLALKAQFIDVPFNPYAPPLVRIEMDLEHDDDKRQERGQRDFAALRRAVGVLNPQDTEELLFKPFRAVVAHADGPAVIRGYVFGDESLAA